MPLLCSRQQTLCVTSSQVPQEAEEVLEQGRAKSIKTEPRRSQQSLAVSLSPLAPCQAQSWVCSPMSGSRGADPGQSGLGQINAKG